MVFREKFETEFVRVQDGSWRVSKQDLEILVRLYFCLLLGGVYDAKCMVDGADVVIVYRGRYLHTSSSLGVQELLLWAQGVKAFQ